MALGASLVWRVARTKWPVREAWMASCAVSGSRISPTRMTSGSWRRSERRPVAKVTLRLTLTCICEMPSMWYSTGSSMVMTLREFRSIRPSAAYRVVVLPEPVGPVTRRMPLGRSTQSMSRVCIFLAMPTASRSSSWLD